AREAGAAGERDQIRDALLVMLETLRVYVQGLCSASPEQASQLASAAGMKLVAARTSTKLVLAVKAGKEAGTVDLSACAKLLSKLRGQKCYHWQYCTNGKDWIQVPSTPKTRTTIAGIPLLTTCSFRVAVTDQSGMGEWSQVVTFLLH